MILKAFDVKFDDKNKGMPPKACKLQKTNPILKKMHQEMDAPPARPPERIVPGAAVPLGRKKRCVSNLSSSMRKVSGLGQA